MVTCPTRNRSWRGAGDTVPVYKMINNRYHLHLPPCSSQTFATENVGQPVEGRRQPLCKVTFHTFRHCASTIDTLRPYCSLLYWGVFRVIHKAFTIQTRQHPYASVLNMGLNHRGYQRRSSSTHANYKRSTCQQLQLPNITVLRSQTGMKSKNVRRVNHFDHGSLNIVDTKNTRVWVCSFKCRKGL